MFARVFQFVHATWLNILSNVWRYNWATGWLSTLFKNINVMHFRDVFLPLKDIHRSRDKLYGDGKACKAKEYCLSCEKWSFGSKSWPKAVRSTQTCKRRWTLHHSHLGILRSGFGGLADSATVSTEKNAAGFLLLLRSCLKGTIVDWL